MATGTTRVLIASGLLLATLVALLPFGPIVPGAKAEASGDRNVFTLDRGGMLRFNNGKTDVETAYPFTLDAGAGQIPLQIGAWQGIDFPLNLEAYESIVPELLVNRFYRGPANEQATLTVIGADTSRKLHRPEICYAAADWLLTDLPIRIVPLEAGEIGVNQMLARSETFHEQRVNLYWYLWHDGRRRIEDGA